MATRTLTIDSQVHAYERNRPERPWIGSLQGPDEVTGDDMVAAMGAVGVDGALLVSPYTMYRYDASYVLEIYAKHPGRFGLIKPFDPESETQSLTRWLSGRLHLVWSEYAPNVLGTSVRSRTTRASIAYSPPEPKPVFP